MTRHPYPSPSWAIADATAHEGYLHDHEGEFSAKSHQTAKRRVCIALKFHSIIIIVLIDLFFFRLSNRPFFARDMASGNVLSLPLELRTRILSIQGTSYGKNRPLLRRSDGLSFIAPFSSAIWLPHSNLSHCCCWPPAPVRVPSSANQER
ncbi:hypothetical protein [Pectobacterium sp. A5351]|uniref:hypothetical protein n=1 Tax=Pectobacterium sp. A5351 TaxID=2914983 RepID=UPI00232D9C77|nr:hypothetical protein [Pectobacterium sp. A5351]WCG82116.1 hypothetical protein O1Q74_14455 [Pectobacterium sp. A5351]